MQCHSVHRGDVTRVMEGSESVLPLFLSADFYLLIFPFWKAGCISEIETNLINEILQAEDITGGNNWKTLIIFENNQSFCRVQIEAALTALLNNVISTT